MQAIARTERGPCCLCGTGPRSGRNRKMGKPFRFVLAVQKYSSRPCRIGRSAAGRKGSRSPREASFQLFSSPVEITGRTLEPCPSEKLGLAHALAGARVRRSRRSGCVVRDAPAVAHDGSRRIPNSGRASPKGRKHPRAQRRRNWTSFRGCNPCGTKSRCPPPPPDRPAKTPLRSVEQRVH